METRKKIIRIAIFLIVIAALVFGVYWFVSRRTAEKNGTTPTSFRNFLGFGVTTHPATGENPGDLSSGFTSPDQSSTTPGGAGSASSTTGTTASQFTNGTLAPGTFDTTGTSTDGSGNTTGDTGGFGNGTGETSTTGSGSTVTTTGATTTPVGTTTPVCTDADVNITFTPEELARLQALQERFYTVAQSLHTDADAATELANYDDFKLKQEHLNELLAYCSTAAPKITNPVYQTRVPTPFWYQLTEVRENGNSHSVTDPFTGLPIGGTTGASVPLGYLGVPGQIGGQVDTVYRGDSAGNALRSIEQVLRLNLW